LCWIFPRDSRCSELAFALAIISAYDRFFGGPESVGLGRLGSGRAGNGLLPFPDVGPPALEVTALGFPFGVRLSKLDCGFRGCLSLELPRGRSAGREDGFVNVPSGREGFSGAESVRATLEGAGRSSSSAFRLGNIALGLRTGLGDGAGFSPVMEASKSRICQDISQHHQPRTRRDESELTGIVTNAPCGECPRCHSLRKSSPASHPVLLPRHRGKTHQFPFASEPGRFQVFAVSNALVEPAIAKCWGKVKPSLRGYRGLRSDDKRALLERRTKEFACSIGAPNVGQQPLFNLEGSRDPLA
jgi:hypothetical protein